MTTSQDIKNTSGEVAETALILATTCSAALGPAGIPLAIFFGSGAGMLALFSPEYEPKTAMSEERLRLIVDKAVKLLTAEIHKTAANTASGRIEAVYDWYAALNRRINDGEEFSKYDLEEIRQQVVDQLSGNSNLEVGMNELSNREIGKYVMAVFALGAILGVKIRLYDIAQQQARGETITSGQMTEVDRYAEEKSGILRGLIRTADMELGILLRDWKAENPKASNNEWLARRDHYAAILWGGPAGLDLLQSHVMEMHRISMGAARISTAIAEHHAAPAP